MPVENRGNKIFMPLSVDSKVDLAEIVIFQRESAKNPLLIQ